MVTIDDPEIIAKGQTLLDAAYDFWKAVHRTEYSGAVQWLEDTNGHVVIFTRGEYRRTLMENIDKLSINQEEALFVHQMPNDEEE